MSITEQERDRQDAPDPPRKSRVPKPARRPLVPVLKRSIGLGWPVALALAICLAGLGVADWADRRSERSPAANRALLDQAAGAKAIGDVSAGIARIFTYSYTDPGSTERAAGAFLTGKAAAQYRGLFGQVRQAAPKHKLALTTKVVRAGLIRLTRDGAAVLVVFLDQNATRAGKPSGDPVAAQLVVTARNDGGWRVSDLRAA